MFASECVYVCVYLALLNDAKYGSRQLCQATLNKVCRDSDSCIDVHIFEIDISYKMFHFLKILIWVNHCRYLSSY